MLGCMSPTWSPRDRSNLSATHAPGPHEALGGHVGLSEVSPGRGLRRLHSCHRHAEGGSTKHRCREAGSGEAGRRRRGGCLALATVVSVVLGVPLRGGTAVSSSSPPEEHGEEGLGRPWAAVATRRCLLMTIPGGCGRCRRGLRKRQRTRFHRWGWGRALRRRRRRSRPAWRPGAAPPRAGLGSGQPGTSNALSIVGHRPTRTRARRQAP